MIKVNKIHVRCLLFRLQRYVMFVLVVIIPFSGRLIILVCNSNENAIIAPLWDFSMNCGRKGKRVTKLFFSFSNSKISGVVPDNDRYTLAWIEPSIIAEEKKQLKNKHWRCTPYGTAPSTARLCLISTWRPLIVFLSWFWIFPQPSMIIVFSSTQRMAIKWRASHAGRVAACAFFWRLAGSFWFRYRPQWRNNGRFCKRIILRDCRLLSFAFEVQISRFV